MTWMAVRASLVCLGSEPRLEEDTVMARIYCGRRGLRNGTGRKMLIWVMNGSRTTSSVRQSDRNELSS